MLAKDANVDPRNRVAIFLVTHKHQRYTNVMPVTVHEEIRGKTQELP